MRVDLLESKACVDWAISQLPSLDERINAWLDLNVNLEIKDPDPNSPNNVIVAAQKEPLPAAFNIEVGSHINTIRSSLDILATSLAHRYGIAKPDEAYFPVAKSEDDFLGGNFKGAKFVKALPTAERTIIETLKPYRGGNAPLWVLHQLDIVRKHRKLLAVATTPARFSITGWGLSDNFTPVASGFMIIEDQETVLGLLRKGAPDYNMKFSAFVAINETDLSIHKPVVAALNDFARLADSIIQLFDVS